MRLVNPGIIPRNHLVEAMIEAAVERSDFGPFEEVAHGRVAPVRRSAGLRPFRRRPPPSDIPYRTFCGT